LPLRKRAMFTIIGSASQFLLVIKLRKIIAITMNHKSIKLLILIFIILLGVKGGVFAQDKAAKIDELMRLYHDYGQFNGSVLVAENGKVIYKKGFGFANMEWKAPNTPDTKFRIASIAKQFTAALILQLVEQGKIKLDGKITDYLPDYRKDTGDGVTIHHLLNHTSGIPDFPRVPGFANDMRNPFTVPVFIKKYTSGDLEFKPGTKYRYNNSAYFLLGAIIERVTGKPYEQVLKERIFDPLGMKNTGYDHHEVILSKRASGYEKSLAGYINGPYMDMSIVFAAGGLYSTVEDLYLWDRAFYTDKILSAKSKELMFKPNLENYGYGFNIGKVSLGESKRTVPEVYHTGLIDGFATMIVRLIEDQHLIVILDNTSQWQSNNRLKVAITNILYDQPYSLPKKSIAEALYKTVMDKGIDAAVNQYRDLKTRESAIYDLKESELNTLGYQLLEMKKHKESIKILKLNVEAFPESANAYDSLGEAYMVNGDKELAIKNYKKSLELNPKNDNAANAIKRLENQLP
jgi:CubicO group peptidase (beta-lactamase class C family)